ncbi:MAG: C40 family peptidase [Bryobacteraceae bacterium]
MKTRRRAARRKGRHVEQPRFEPYVLQNWPEEAVAQIPSAWIDTPPAPPVHGNCRVCETMLLASAYEQIGVRYRLGGASPQTGFDCSGLMRYLFERNFGISLPPTAPQQYQTGLRVEKWELEPGDLVFFRTRRGWHVGLYVGHDSFLHAPNRRKTVRVSPLFSDPYWRRSFVGARRIPLPEPAGAVVSDDLSANNN